MLVSATIRREGPRPQGIYRDSTFYARDSLEGAHLAALTRRYGSEVNAFSPEENSFFFMPPPFGRDAAATVFGNRWYYGSGDSWEIEVYSPEGTLTHLFRRDEPNRPVSKEMEDGYRGLAFGSGEDLPISVSRMIETMPIPETLPAHRSLIVSDNGSFWVENYTIQFPRGPSDLTDTHSDEQPSWAVFREDGRYLGDVDTPMGAQVTHIGDDFVLVIWEDDLEVQQVQMYELIKP